MTGIPAVVIAAGIGSRLRPLTDRYAKPVLPIDGRPVIGSLLRELAAAGCPHATIVIGHLGAQIESLVGDGSAFGIEVRFASQPERLGSADAVVRAREAAPYLVTAADTLYRSGDIGRFVEGWQATGAAGAIAVRRSAATGPGRTVVRAPGGIVTQMLRIETICERRECHRRAGMSGLGGLHGIHRERANGVDRETRGLGIGRGNERRGSSG